MRHHFTVRIKLKINILSILILGYSAGFELHSAANVKTV